jgi:hypothetical protein
MDEGMGLEPGVGRAFPGLWVRKHPSRSWSLSTSFITPLLLSAWTFLLFPDGHSFIFRVTFYISYL